MTIEATLKEGKKGHNVIVVLRLSKTNLNPVDKTIVLTDEENRINLLSRVMVEELNKNPELEPIKEWVIGFGPLDFNKVLNTVVAFSRIAKEKSENINKFLKEIGVSSNEDISRDR